LNCARCKLKSCRSGNECLGDKPAFLPKYFEKDSNEITKTASSLIDNGRAGTLTRVEEVIEFVKDREYGKIGVAYCYAFDRVGEEFAAILDAEGIRYSMVSCTTGALLERELDPAKTKSTVSCNPIGQAMQLKNDGVDFVVEIGLCLGHDILFQRELDCDFTVLAVKDRVLKNSPLNAFQNHSDTNSDFISKIEDENFRTISREELYSEISKESDIYLVNIVGSKGFHSSLDNFTSMTIKQLAISYRELIPSKETKIIITSENPFASSYAMMFLYGRGYGNSRIFID